MRRGKPFPLPGWWAAGAALLITAVVGPALAADRPIQAASDGPLREFTHTVPPRPVPDFAFTDKAGQSLSIAGFRGQVVLLNIWATWCAPCVKEMPALDRLQAKLAADRAVVIALSIDRGGLEAVLPFYERMGLTHLGIFLDPPSKSWPAFRIKALPATILIDPEGREVGRIEGAVEWDAPEAVALIRSYTRP
jgi:thiol-disulfide isomerase/thioredoxin